MRTLKGDIGLCLMLFLDFAYLAVNQWHLDVVQT